MTLKLAVSNLGPLQRAEAELRHLTVLVGVNNTGKSFLATLLYAALSVVPYSVSSLEHPRSVRSRIRGRARGGVFSYLDVEDSHPLLVEAEELAQKLANGSLVEGDLSDSMLAFLNRAAQSALEEYALNLVDEAGRCFGVRLSDLVRLKNGRRQPARFTLINEDPHWTVTVRPRRAELAGVEATHHVDFKELLSVAFQRSENRRDRARPLLHLPFSSRLSERPALLLRDLANLVAFGLFGGLPDASFYLPAARSGILQSHKALADVVISRSALVDVEDLSVQRLSGVVADFIRELLSIEPPRVRRGDKHDNVERYLEANVLGGTIRVDQGPTSYPDILYHAEESDFPLLRTSSMVSEIAPIVLYIRYLLTPDRVLLIEEPEAHLHPESQVHVATAITQLVRLGVKVVLTTHSDLFLQQLNNSILAAEARKIASVPESLADLPPINGDDVAAYLFARRPDQGTVTKRLPVRPREGISDEDFSRVYEELYERTLKLDRRLSDAG